MDNNNCKEKIDLGHYWDLNRGYYTMARRYEFYFRAAKLRE